MLSKTIKALTFALATLGVATTNVGVVAPTVGFTAGLAASYLANPEPAYCKDGSCAPAKDWICGLNGVNYNNKMYISNLP